MVIDFWLDSFIVPSLIASLLTLQTGGRWGRRTSSKCAEPTGDKKWMILRSKMVSLSQGDVGALSIPIFMAHITSGWSELHKSKSRSFSRVHLYLLNWLHRKKTKKFVIKKASHRETLISSANNTGDCIYNASFWLFQGLSSCNDTALNQSCTRCKLFNFTIIQCSQYFTHDRAIYRRIKL